MFFLPNNMLFLLFLSVGYIISAHAEKSTPLWTPEDVVALPFVDIKGVSSDGKYTITQLLETSDKDQKEDRHLRCILVNNENLTQEIIGKTEDWCSEAHFIGQEDKISYLVQNNDFTSTLFIKDIVTNKSTEIQKLGQGERKPVFSPDGKSYVYTEISIFKDDSPRRIAGQEVQLKLKLYHQKLDENLKPMGKPQLLTPESLIVSVPANSYQADYIWSPDGKTLLFAIGDARWKDISYVTLNLIHLKEKRIEKLMEGNYVVGSLLFSPDGKRLAALKASLNGTQVTGMGTFPKSRPLAIDIINISTKKISSLPAVDILSIIGWAADNKGLIVTKQEGTKQKLGVLDIKNQDLSFKNLQDMTVVTNAVLSKNQKYLGFAAQSLYQPLEIYITEFNDFKPKKITSVNKKIDLKEIRAHSLKWKSFDGVEIEGILIYPQGYQKGQKVPLIVSIHGGPTTAESESFIGSTWIDYFSPAVVASLGYATL